MHLEFFCNVKYFAMHYIKKLLWHLVANLLQFFICIHIYASLLVVRGMLAQNVISKYNQIIIYASWLLNLDKHKYFTIEYERFLLWYLHDLSLGTTCCATSPHCVPTMALVYMVHKPQILKHIVQWLLVLNWNMVLI